MKWTRTKIVQEYAKVKNINKIAREAEISPSKTKKY